MEVPAKRALVCSFRRTTKWHESTAATELANHLNLNMSGVCCCDYERSHAGEELPRNDVYRGRTCLGLVARPKGFPSSPQSLDFWSGPRICVTLACPSHMSIPENLPDFTFWSRMHAQTEGSAPRTLHEIVPSSNVQRTPSCRVSCYNGCSGGSCCFSFHGLLRHRSNSA